MSSGRAGCCARRNPRAQYEKRAPHSWTEPAPSQHWPSSTKQRVGKNCADMAMNKCTHGKEDALETGQMLGG